MQRIVVGVDTSDGARRALTWAVEEAKIRGAIVEAVHVWQLPVFAVTPLGTLPIDTGEFEVDAQKHFDDLVDAMDVDGLVAPIERTFVAGHPASELVEAAEGADLLVVGTRGHGGFSGLLLGSTSQQVSHHAPCPVVIVPAEQRR
jgi:nucleotide-binding universal stress UspA family protein